MIQLTGAQILLLVATPASGFIVFFALIWRTWIAPIIKSNKELIEWRANVEHRIDRAEERHQDVGSVVEAFMKSNNGILDGQRRIHERIDKLAESVGKLCGSVEHLSRLKES